MPHDAWLVNCYPITGHYSHGRKSIVDTYTAQASVGDVNKGLTNHKARDRYTFRSLNYLMNETTLESRIVRCRSLGLR